MSGAHLNIDTERSRLFAEKLGDGRTLIQVDIPGAMGSARAVLAIKQKKQLAGFLLGIGAEQ